MLIAQLLAIEKISVMTQAQESQQLLKTPNMQHSNKLVVKTVLNLAHKQ